MSQMVKTIHVYRERKFDGMEEIRETTGIPSGLDEKA